MNWRKFDCPILAIDLAYQSIDHRLQHLVFFHILTRWHCDLYQYHFFQPFRMTREEMLKCMQLLRNAFDVIQAIYTHQYFNTLELGLQPFNSIDYGWRV